MIIPQEWDYNYDEEISNEEYEVIDKFLASYRNQSVIVADESEHDFSMVPLEEKNISFGTSEDTLRSMNFCRKIYYKRKPYVVELKLCRPFCFGHKENIPNCLSISEFRIITNEKVHFININTTDIYKKKWLLNIISFFDEKKVISPEQAYCKRMYTYTNLQHFINCHEWKRINEGLNQMPTLANALFIIREGYEGYDDFTADFGTILYQLISFRQNNQTRMYENDLYELDKLILKLSKTELLKVQLCEYINKSATFPASSILLKASVYESKVYRSQQYNVANTELTEEKKILNKCIRNLKK